MYLALGTLSVREQLGDDGGDPKEDAASSRTYFDSMPQAAFVICIGLYIVLSHTWAIYYHIGEYEELSHEVMSLLHIY